MIGKPSGKAPLFGLQNKNFEQNAHSVKSGAPVHIGTVKALGMPPLTGKTEAVTNPASSLAR
jgi:hypothetical protein